MKNYNRRGLIIGIVQLLLSVFCFITMIVTGFVVKMKAKAKSFDIASNFLFLATIAVMIAYGITKNHVFVYMVLCTGAALSVCWISHIIAHFYYESKN